MSPPPLGEKENFAKITRPISVQWDGFEELIEVKTRDIIAKEMTPADLSAAQKLARECIRKKYKGC